MRAVFEASVASYLVSQREIETGMVLNNDAIYGHIGTSEIF